ncbi:hypothetical protein Taro_029303 [Colocasia esculenta]|uniref:Histone-lysine N-methyltransferase ASHH1 n=1 Tax=Colocasia esculenta TaxID=4460 RepID=A0A843VJH6_COLES|nr:hypothetical protein [Colocasia esculenta]
MCAFEQRNRQVAEASKSQQFGFLKSRQKPGTIRSAREGREHNGMAHVVEAGATNVGSKRSSTPDQQGEGPPLYKHIERNEHRKQKDEDIVVCVCKFDADDPDSACGERCLNVLTSMECTLGYCPYSRGWGLLADEDIMAGQFVIEYCGEVISWKEAKRRSQVYEVEGRMDAYIISLNASESIDATKKGSLASQPNCETRKWTVLGEIRVGIFAKQDIPTGTELAYDYNFEYYGGVKVRCLCGAASCSRFLGAKSRGFQPAPIAVVVSDEVQTETGEDKLLYSQETNQFTHNAMISRIRSNSACRNYHIEPSSSSKMFPRYSNGKTKFVARKQVNVKRIAERLASLDACQELLAFEVPSSGGVGGDEHEDEDS